MSETGMGQQEAQLHDSYMMMVMTTATNRMGRKNGPQSRKPESKIYY
jgi:hypothetical protein